MKLEKPKKKRLKKGEEPDTADDGGPPRLGGAGAAPERRATSSSSASRRRAQGWTITAKLAESSSTWTSTSCSRGARVLVRGRFWEYKKGLTDRRAA